MSEQWLPGRQYISLKGLSVTVFQDDRKWAILRASGVEHSSTYCPSPRLARCLNLDLEGNCMLPDVDPGEPIRKLRQVVSAYLGHHSPADNAVALLHIVGTYCYRMFSCYPDMWMFVPDIDMHEQVMRLYDKTALNCFRSSQIASARACHQIIREYTPTLLLEDPRLKSSARWKFLTQEPNTYDQRLITDEKSTDRQYRICELAVMNMHAPRVIVSTSLPPSTALRHTIPLAIYPDYLDADESIDLYATLRADLLVSVVRISPRIAQEIEHVKVDIAENDPRLPYVVLANVLASDGLISDRERDDVNTFLNSTHSRKRRNFEIHEDEQILMAIANYLQDPNRKPDEYHKLDSLVEHMHAFGIGHQVWPWSLSRFLNKRRLIEDSKRPWIDDDGSGPKLQRTAVKIDINQLKRLTVAYVTWP